MSTFEVLNQRQIERVVLTRAPALLQQAAMLIFRWGRITIFQPLLPRSSFVSIVVGPATPNVFIRTERRLVDEVPDHIINATATFGKSRDELLLCFDRTRIEIRIFTTPRLGQESK